MPRGDVPGFPGPRTTSTASAGRGTSISARHHLPSFYGRLRFPGPGLDHERQVGIKDL